MQNIKKELKSPKKCTKSIKLMVLAISTKKKSPFKSFLSDFILGSLMETYLKNYKGLKSIFTTKPVKSTLPGHKKRLKSLFNLPDF